MTSSFMHSWRDKSENCNSNLTGEKETDGQLCLVTIDNILCCVSEWWQSQSDSSSIIIHMAKNSLDDDLFYDVHILCTIRADVAISKLQGC